MQKKKWRENMTCEEFVYKAKNYYNEIECIIAPDGNIVEVPMGHYQTMVYLTKMGSQYIEKMMPIDSAPIFWMSDYAKYVTVSEKICIFPEHPTKEQFTTLEKIAGNIPWFNPEYVQPHELQQCGMRQRYLNVQDEKYIDKLKAAERYKTVSKAKEALLNTRPWQVLIIDDESHKRIIEKGILNDYFDGYVEIDEADTFESGASKIQDKVYDLIICDMCFPRSTGRPAEEKMGLNVLAWLEVNKYFQPIIICSTVNRRIIDDNVIACIEYSAAMKDKFVSILDRFTSGKV